MKQKTKAFLAKALISVFGLSLVGGILPLLETPNVAEAATTKTAVTPYLEYLFNDSANPWKNTGKATNGNMTAWGTPQNVGSWGLKVTESGSYDGGISLRLEDKNDSFVQTDEFTFSMSFYIDGRASWHSVPVSWSSYNTTTQKRVSRTYLLIGNNSTHPWMKFGDTDLTDGGTVKNQYYNHEGKELIPNNNATNPGWTNLVVSIKAGGKAYVKARISSGTVYELEYDVPADWTLFDSTNGNVFDFALGASATYNNGVAYIDKLAESKSKIQMDNVRFYDVAMTETQIDSYISDVGATVYTYGVDIPEVEGGKVTADKTQAMLGETVTFTVTPDAGATVKTVSLNGESVVLNNNQFTATMTTAGMTVDASFKLPAPTYTAEIRPELEYLFNSNGTLFENTGNADGYTLEHTGTVTDGFNANFNCYYFNNNSTLYLQTKDGKTNNWFYDNSVNTFTVAFDTQAYRNKSSNWWQTAMNWVTLTDGSNAKSNLSTFMVGYSSSHDWFGFSDTTLTTKKSGSTWYTNLGDTLYAGDKTATNSGWVRIVYSVEPGAKAYVKIYDLTTANLLGQLSYDVANTWSPYGNGSDFTFSLGGSFTKNGSYASNESRYIGNMDNVRVYDFAMTEDQMEEYAKYGKVSTSGIQFAEMENGKVTTNNYTPEVGEEVVFNVAPNAGYELVELKVNGETLEAVDGVYKTKMIYDGLYVEATFDLTAEGKLLKAVSMGHGAGVRYGGTADYSGLRFRIQSPKAEYEKLDVTAEYGILVIPADYEKTYGKFTVENLFGANAKYHLAERDGDGNMVEYTGNLPQIMNFWTDELYYNAETDCYEYYGSITNINAKNLTRQFVGVGVAKYGDNYVVLNYAGNDIVNNTRSVYQVSKLVVLDETADPIAKAWVERNYIKAVESAVSVLANKKLSVIGDSISTYEGVSNNATANSTIGGNAVFYKTQMALNDTWWKQTADNTGMEILVNNSWSSSNVAVYGDNTLTSKAGCGDRAVNLHDDTNNVNPDVIAAYIGINDCGCLTSVGDFDEVSDIWDGEKYVGEFTTFSRAYARMVHQIVTKYDGADVFLFTLPRNGYLWKGTKAEYNALQDEYNKTIRKIAEIFGCQVVELSAAVGENYSEYLLSDNIHPNAKGMDIITAAFETVLYSYYTENEQ